MSHSSKFARFFQVLFGAVAGGIGGFAAGLVLNQWVYADSGAGAAGGGDGIETVLIGLAMYGFFFAVLGGSFAGSLAFKATAPTTSGKKPSYVDELG
jgi:hypothetical protein